MRKGGRNCSRAGGIVRPCLTSSLALIERNSKGICYSFQLLIRVIFAPSRPDGGLSVCQQLVQHQDLRLEEQVGEISNLAPRRHAVNIVEYGRFVRKKLVKSCGGL